MSLFLLYPGAGTAGIVLAVLGICAWLGLQQLNYREITELKRLARRTIDQKRIITNNLAVEYATEHLPKATSTQEVVKLLEGMFQTNDFDAFELEVFEKGEPREVARRVTWGKADAEPGGARWSMAMKRSTDDGFEHGQSTIYRES